MTQPLHVSSSAELVVRVLQSGRMTQKELGELLGYHKRTVVRWVQRGTTFLPVHCAMLARRVYPDDPPLAATLASMAGTDLVALGLEAPPPPQGAGARARGPASDADVADAIVCAAAEAMDASPRLARKGLRAALARAAALGMSGEELLAVLGEGKGRAKKG